MQNCRNRHLRKTVLALSLGALSIVPMQMVLAQDGRTVRLDIPAQDLSTALTQFGRETDTEIVFAPDAVQEKRAAAVQGEYKRDQALSLLLAGSGLTHRVTSQGAIVIERSGVDADAQERSDPGDVVNIDTVTVTGSRIRKQDVESNNPFALIDRRQIESASTGNVIDVINRSPQLSLGGDLQVDTDSEGFKNTGISTANLRGLGTNRTLVLVNGRRQVAGTSGTSAVDLNTISKSSLQRVEIVTGGSSAVYGADAIAGVINLITRQDFDGILGEAQTGFTEHGGGATRNLAVTLGKNFAEGRGNVMLSLSHDRENPIYWAQRKYGWAPGGVRGDLSYVANPAWTEANPTVPRFVPVYGNSLIIYRQYGHPVISMPVGQHAPFSLSFDDAGNLIPFDMGTRLVDGAGRPQFTAIGCPDCWTDSERTTARNGVERNGVELQAVFSFLEGGDGFLSDVEGFLEAKRYAVDSAMRKGFANFAGSGPSQDRAGGYAIAIDNPYAPTALVDLMRANGLNHVDVTRINNDIGVDINALRAAYAAGRHALDRGGQLDMTSEYRMQRYVAGLRGAFGNGWNFEIYGNYGQTDATFTNADFMESLFRQQIDAVVDPASGRIVCRSTLADPGNGCTPINIVGAGMITMEDVAYSYRRPVQRDTITQTNFVGTVDGTLFSWNSPISGVELPVGFAAGVEYRREASRTIPDEYGASGDLFFLGPKVATVGHYSSWEAFGELNLPLLRDVPWAESLEISGSYRYQDYTTTGTDGSYGLSASWAPISDVKFRGAFARAVRAPNVSELFSGTNTSMQGIDDPCDIVNLDLGPAPANRRANCRAILGGQADEFIQSPSRKLVVLQGNPNLDAETADTLTAGVVITPRAIPNLVVSADYWTNQIDDVITSLSASQIVENCVDSSGIDNEFCGAVTRESSGNLDTVIAQVFNLARYRTHGWDLGASYMFGDPSGRGRVALQANATYLMELVYDPVPSNPTLRSRLDRISPNPTWRGNFSAGYELRDFVANWNVRYIGDVIRDWNEVIGETSMSTAHPKSGSYLQHDLRLGYRFGEHQIYVGIDNVFDAHAPMTPFTYLSPMYSRIGRSFYAGVKVRF